MSEGQRGDANSDFAREFQRARAVFNENDPGTRQQIHKIEAGDRSWIARAVIRIFAGTILAAFLVFLAEGIFIGRWDAVATQTFDLVRSAVLPVVTLILGYYFGRSAASEHPRRSEGDIA